MTPLNIRGCVSMISEYRRGWEDALDVVLELKDWDKIKLLYQKLRNYRIRITIDGPK